MRYNYIHIEIFDNEGKPRGYTDVSIEYMKAIQTDLPSGCAANFLLSKINELIKEQEEQPSLNKNGRH